MCLQTIVIATKNKAVDSVVEKVSAFRPCALYCNEVARGDEGLQGVTRVAYSPSLWLMAIGW
jgi:hypothetical protein